jgi:hypothetical protein
VNDTLKPKDNEVTNAIVPILAFTKKKDICIWKPENRGLFGKSMFVNYHKYQERAVKDAIGLEKGQV